MFLWVGLIWTNAPRDCNEICCVISNSLRVFQTRFCIVIFNKQTNHTSCLAQRVLCTAQFSIWQELVNHAVTNGLRPQMSATPTPLQSCSSVPWALLCFPHQNSTSSEYRRYKAQGWFWGVMNNKPLAEGWKCPERLDSWSLHSLRFCDFYIRFSNPCRSIR